MLSCTSRTSRGRHLLSPLHPRRDLLRGHLRRRIVAELLHQPCHRRKDPGLLLVVHQPFDELRVNGLALRRSRKDRPGGFHALDKRLVDLAVADLSVT